MVKIVTFFLLLSTLLFANIKTVNLNSNLSVLLNNKVKMFIGDASYKNNKAFVHIIFKPYKNFFVSNKINIIKVIKTLKDSGLLKLFFKKPQHISISFSSNGPALYFVKLVSQALRSIGYYRYITKKAHLDLSGFVWTIDFTSDYVIGPIILNNALHKLGCNITSISLQNPTSWSYQINMQNAHLNSKILHDNLPVEIHRSLYSPWFNVSLVKKIQITSNGGNHWYPEIIFYDKYLKILKILKINRKIYQISLNIPKDSIYMKLSDIYNLQNISNGLKIIALGKR